MDYRSAGVDVEAGRAFVDRIRTSVEATHRPEVVGGLGGFGGLIRLPEGLRKPLLVSGTDGVGTKLELAQDHNSHHNVGLDLVAMCVNDVITSGAEPLFFLDYMATGALSLMPWRSGRGIAWLSTKRVCTLGGETARCLASTQRAVTTLQDFVLPWWTKTPSMAIGYGSAIPSWGASSGVHSNGWLGSQNPGAMRCRSDARFGSEQALVIDALLAHPSLRISHQETSDKSIPINAMAHITGGGIPENLPRCLPEGLRAHVDPNSWPRPDLFTWLQTQGDVQERDLWHTFNLGIGYCLVLPESEVVGHKRCVKATVSADRPGDPSRWAAGGTGGRTTG